MPHPSGREAIRKKGTIIRTEIRARLGQIIPSESAGIISTINSGSATLDFEEVSRSFPAWTVTREFWKQALKTEISGIAVDVRLFHKSGRRLIHKYRVYRDPLPHPALREGRITKLLSFVNRAMVIAQLTHLRIAVPSSGKCQVTAFRR